MNHQEALLIVHNTLKPTKLSNIEQVVLIETLAGKRYKEIAASTKYDVSYIRDVGARTWRALSQALGTKVTKKNVYIRLYELYETLDYVIQPDADAVDEPVIPSPGSLISATSRQFVLNESIENQIYQVMCQPGGLVNLQASSKMGKTCLAHIVCARLSTADLNVVYLNLSQAERAQLSDISRLLRWMVVNIESQLCLVSALEDYWMEEVGSKVSCTTYFQEVILASLEKPLVLVIDDLCCLQACPSVLQELLTMFRHWHEQSAVRTQWAKLRLFLVFNTEKYLALDLEYSPVNVGVSIRLPHWSLKQIEQISDSYGLQLSSLCLESLFQLTGGHPYLVHLTVHYFYEQAVNVDAFFAPDCFYDGIYDSFLIRKLSLVGANLQLKKVLKKIIADEAMTDISLLDIYQLQNMGLVLFDCDHVRFSCLLYEVFFTQRVFSPLVPG